MKATDTEEGYDIPLVYYSTEWHSFIGSINTDPYELIIEIHRERLQQYIEGDISINGITLVDSSTKLSRPHVF